MPPRIEIVRVFARSTPSNEALYDVAAVLVTRQTDRIILSDGIVSSATDEELKKNENNEVFMQKVEKIATEKSKLFSSDIEISYNKDDSILDIYGIRNWVESLPEKKISITTLANSYKIIGL